MVLQCGVTTHKLKRRSQMVFPYVICASKNCSLRLNSPKQRPAVLIVSQNGVNLLGIHTDLEVPLYHYAIIYFQQIVLLRIN